MGVEAVDRTQFIGGSDISAILGLSRYQTPLGVWAEKTGQVVKKDGPKPMRMRVGTKMEDVIAELWMEETGKVLNRVTERRVHPKYPHFRAQIDRLVIGEEATWEGKNTNWRLKKDWAEGEAPQEAICQAMWGLAVTGKRHSYICGLIDNEELRWVKIERDPVLIAEMLKRAEDFWQTFIVPKVMPGQVSAADADTLYALFPQAEPASQIDLGDQGAIIIENRNALIQDKIQLERQIELHENQLKIMLKEKEAGTAGKWKVSWKNQKRKAYTVAAAEFRRLNIKELNNG